VTWDADYTLLHWAAERGHTDLCHYLLHLDADPQAHDLNERSALDYAKEAGHEELAATFQQFCAKQKRRSEEVLAEWRQTKMVTFCISEGTEEETEEEQPALTPAEQCDVDRGPIPETFIRVMAQVDEVGWERMDWAHGFTLLHWAAKDDRPLLCQRFLAQRADLQAMDTAGRTALACAREFGSEGAVAILEQATLAAAS